MDNIKDEILHEAMKTKVTKTLSPSGMLVVSFNVNDYAYVIDKLLDYKLTPRFIRDRGKNIKRRLVLIETNDAYIQMDGVQNTYYSADIKIKPLKDLPIIPPFDFDNPDVIPVWFGNIPRWSTQHGPISKIHWSYERVERLLPYFTHNMTSAVVDQLLKKKQMDITMFDLLEPLMHTGIENQGSLHFDVIRKTDDINIIRRFVDEGSEYEWTSISENFTFSQETLEEFKNLINWHKVLGKLILPPDLLKKYKEEGYFQYWEKI